MKVFLKIAAVTFFLLFLAAQFIRPDLTNPPIDPSQTIEASGRVPEKVSAILNRSCADCHSRKTSYPWYSQVSPVSWFLANHISEGRRELDLSVWNTYSDAKKRRKLAEICEMAMDKRMPLDSYLWIHRDAKLTDEDIKTLCDWTGDELVNAPS